MKFISVSLGPIVWLILSALPAGAADYEKEVKPLLKKRCTSCHGPLKQKSGLRLDTGKAIHKGSDDGPVLEKLIEKVSSKDEEDRMPQESSPLSAAEIELLKSWIAAGAPYPENETATKSPESHWSFQSVRPVAVPEVRNSSWPRNPIDQFILARLEEKGWDPAPRANSQSLLRRVYLDLIGLPPSVEEQERFREKPDLPALVEDLLSRRGYGERWGRHWLDAVRYADTNGYERDAIKPYVWRYRDYVIDSLNADKPYDRFVVEQLAGDELDEFDAETMIATGFLRLGHWDDEPADPATDRYDQLDDILNTTSQSLLGITLACARCHDHKFEPFSQRDYYSLLAVFAPLERPRNGRTELALPAGTWEEVERIEARDVRIAEIRAEFEKEFLRSRRSKLPEEVVSALLDPRDDEQEALAKKHRKTLDEELKKAEPPAEIARLKKEIPYLPLAYRWKEDTRNIPDAHVLVRGQPGRHGEAVEPDAPEILSKGIRTAFPAPHKHTTGRRLGLARWIVHPDNPLAARVIVNRVWMHHFGKGLVNTPNDFGIMGEAPSHPELLDWLSYWFMNEAGWSLKELHRLILNSETWQMSSKASRPEYAVADPDNRLLWRQNYRRLEVEAIRDSILFVSGQLNREMHGPHTYPSMPPQALEGHSDPEKVWEPLDEESASRRTIYAYVKRSLMLPMLEVLDVCDTTQPSPGRRVTTVATQALTLFNSEFVNRQSRHLARRLREEAGAETDDRIRHAYRLALCREPNDSELSAMKTFLEEESLEQMCRVVLNLNEFVYPD